MRPAVPARFCSVNAVQPRPHPAQRAEDMSSFRVGCHVVFTCDQGPGSEHKEGDTGKIVEFDKDGDPVIFAHSWDRTFNLYRSVFEHMRVVSEDEYERLTKG